eukprot:1157607-Pelagomonas_calceolata.AAC.7
MAAETVDKGHAVHGGTPKLTCSRFPYTEEWPFFQRSAPHRAAGTPLQASSFARLNLTHSFFKNQDTPWPAAGAPQKSGQQLYLPQFDTRPH